jgi:hypothetical protein
MHPQAIESFANLAKKRRPFAAVSQKRLLIEHKRLHQQSFLMMLRMPRNDILWFPAYRLMARKRAVARRLHRTN